MTLYRVIFFAYRVSWFMNMVSLTATKLSLIY